jgi:hypothetical protein
MIFERLIRKMGFDEVVAATPPEHHKVSLMCFLWLKIVENEAV